MIRIGVTLAALLLGGCNLADRAESNESTSKNDVAGKRDGRRLQQACASAATYDRLKELAFDEAARIRGDDARALDQIAGAAVVRMENPVVRSRDEATNVTLCSGRFILELPPGTENAFDGERRLTADVQYAAQNAADGSGMVYQMEGAEPIIYRLATVGGLVRGRTAPPAMAQAAPVPSPRPSVPPPAREPAPAPAREPVPQAAPRQAAPPPPQVQANIRPSFDCRNARSRSERRVCANAPLAARDRHMSSVFYAALADADPETRRALRASRNRFLAYRERCGDDACIAQAYSDRVEEIRDIAGR